ncbi:hypothetical protein K4A83_14980 [Spirulina subsalsa FACHB-351]|uniref:Uncharacterized protein n=1 Tax=Spirulina subsalsa FACHB-351 TaxID=234711 RepID=A0ABT3L8Z3_9CYAN|nr:hypothetical protein [Spirulina subsalsa]MCW6037569.1 hypothetical protein [Spirulina subsalsa FACHB-351]
MAIIALRAWYVEDYEPIREIVKRPHDLRLSRNSLLKSGLRADFLDDRVEVETSDWFGRYLAGETVEFYLEGSGCYAISNIDLISQEIYFTKLDSTTALDPVIFFSYQREYPPASEMIREALEEAIAKLNERSRHPLILQLAQRPTEAPLRLSSQQLRQIRKSLLVIFDGSPVSSLAGDKTPQLLLSPVVCAELGYALNHKRSGQMLLLQQERLEGQMPFDLMNLQQVSFKTAHELKKTLPPLLQTLLQPLHLVG